MKSSTYYIHMKTKILADFQICISVPLRSSFGRKVMSAVVEREYTPDITRYICFAYQLTGLYDKRFY